MTTEQTAQQFELAAKILRTGHPWEWQASDGEWVKPTIRTELHHVISDGLAIRLALATPPDGRPLHNPNNLTTEQVGAGYRLAVEGDKLDTSCHYWSDDKSWKFCHACSHLGSHETYRLPLSVPWPEPQPDPYAELKKAHAEGKVIQILNAQNRYVDADPTWHSPPEAYRIKPEPTFQLPTPPPGMQWHREDGWREGDLPQGTRPLVVNEESQPGDEHWTLGRGPWKALNLGGFIYDEGHTRCRTRRPLTFTHAGKTWTWHRAVEPMPCDGTKRVIPLVCYEGKYSTGGNMEGSHWDWNDEYLIGWRYADEKKIVPFDISDVPPCSVLSLNPPRWFDIYGACKEGIYVLDDEPLVETLWKWDYLLEKVKINRSIPLTGKWNPDAWEHCHKEVDA